MIEGASRMNAVRKTAHVPLEPARAFEVFTAEMGRWWPLASHSVGLADAADVRFPVAPGDSIVEVLVDGTTHVWGTLLDRDPPHRVRFTWHPGSSPAQSTEVEVRFSEVTDGTLVELIHSGWDRRPDGTAARERYDTGWDLVVSGYLEAAHRG